MFATAGQSLSRLLLLQIHRQGQGDVTAHIRPLILHLGKADVLDHAFLPVGLLHLVYSLLAQSFVTVEVTYLAFYLL